MPKYDNFDLDIQVVLTESIDDDNKKIAAASSYCSPSTNRYCPPRACCD